MAHYAYLNMTRLKAAAGDTLTTDDALWRRVLETASEQIDLYCNRTFRIFTATRVYTPKFSDRLDIDDLLGVTTFKTDASDAYTYGTTWATTDYALWPYNATSERTPYLRVFTKPNGTQSFRLAEQSVQIVGKWGFWEDLETLTATTNEALDASETGVDVSSASEFGVCDTILVDSEQMYITSISSNTLTVVRGVNGTTAATHTTAAAIQRYRYPSPIVDACQIQALRTFNRKDSPMGVVGIPSLGNVWTRTVNTRTMTGLQGMDTDAAGLLGQYRRYKRGVV